MLSIRDGVTLPSDKQEEFCHIQFCNRHLKCIYFSLPRKISSTKSIFERIEKRMVDSCGDSLSFCLGNMRKRRLPCEICFFQFKNNGYELLRNRSGGGYVLRSD